MLVKLVRCHSVQIYIKIHRVKIACLSMTSKQDRENCFCAGHNLQSLITKYFNQYIYTYAQCRVPVFSRATAAKLNHSTSSNTILALFYNKKFLNNIDKTEVMPFGAH